MDLPLRKPVWSLSINFGRTCLRRFAIAFEVKGFCWKMINPTEEDVLDVYVAILSCHIQKSGVYDYEYFYFTHEDMDYLFG